MNQSKFAHSRIDIIGSNGNDGNHYEHPFDVPELDQEWHKKDSSNYSTLEEEEYFKHIEANQVLKQERYKDADETALDSQNTNENGFREVKAVHENQSEQPLEVVKQDRYKDANGEDWIDECARTLTPEEFRGAMKFNIGKYNRRAGKKDALIKEIEKIKDYADRWIRYENGRL